MDPHCPTALVGLLQLVILEGDERCVSLLTLEWALCQIARFQYRGGIYDRLPVAMYLLERHGYLSLTVEDKLCVLSVLCHEYLQASFPQQQIQENMNELNQMESERFNHDRDARREYKEEMERLKAERGEYKAGGEPSCVTYAGAGAGAGAGASRDACADASVDVIAGAGDREEDWCIPHPPTCLYPYSRPSCRDSETLDASLEEFKSRKKELLGPEEDSSGDEDGDGAGSQTEETPLDM